MAGGKGGGLGGRGNKAGSSRKGAQMGSGGQRRKSLEGKGPTPRAEMRKGHPAQRRADAATKRAQSPRSGSGNQRQPAKVEMPAIPDPDPNNPVAVQSTNLLKLAYNLKSEVDKTTKDTLSVTVVRQAAEIELLARKMRTK